MMIRSSKLDIVHWLTCLAVLACTLAVATFDGACGGGHSVKTDDVNGAREGDPPETDVPSQDGRQATDKPDGEMQQEEDEGTEARQEGTEIASKMSATGQSDVDPDAIAEIVEDRDQKQNDPETAGPVATCDQGSVCVEKLECHAEGGELCTPTEKSCGSAGECTPEAACDISSGRCTPESTCDSPSGFCTPPPGSDLDVECRAGGVSCANRFQCTALGVCTAEPIVFGPPCDVVEYEPSGPDAVFRHPLHEYACFGGWRVRGGVAPRQ